MESNQSLIAQFRGGNVNAFQDETQQKPANNYNQDYQGTYNQNQQWGQQQQQYNQYNQGSNQGYNDYNQDNYNNYGHNQDYNQDLHGFQNNQDQYNPTYENTQAYPNAQVNHAQTLYQPQSTGSYTGADMPIESQPITNNNNQLQNTNKLFGGSNLPDMSGIAKNFRDIMNLRKQEPPQLEVCEPQIKGGTTGKHHIYKIRGSDSVGVIEIFRRYSNFHELREIMFARFLGLYVPPIPAKKSVGNKDNQVVEERTVFLDRFIKDICQLPYLYESQEFQIFIRPNGDVEKALAALPKLTTDELLARFRQVMPVNEMANDLKIKNYNEKINDFVKDCRDFIDHLKKFKKHMKQIVPIKEQEVMHYREFVDFLIKYEEINVKKATADEPFQATIISGEGRFDIKNQLQETSQNLKNPFKQIKNWVKGEIMELGALIEAISRKEGVEAQKSKTQSKVKDKKETADKLSTGKFTLKGMFKSKDGKASSTQHILQKISQGEKDIQNYDIIKNYLIIYLAEIAIPCFKHQKMQNYVKAMSAFCDQEIKNSSITQECWSNFIQSIKKVQIK